MNYVVLFPEGEVFPHKFVSPGIISETGVYLAEQIQEVINDLSSCSIGLVAVIADGAGACLKAGKILSLIPDARHIFSITCAAHTMNLIIKSIVGLPGFKQTLEKAVELTRWINDHRYVLAEFRKIQEINNIETGLLLPGDTRWISQVTCVENILKNKNTIAMLLTTTTASDTDC